MIFIKQQDHLIVCVRQHSTRKQPLVSIIWEVRIVWQTGIAHQKFRILSQISQISPKIYCGDKAICCLLYCVSESWAPQLVPSLSTDFVPRLQKPHPQIRGLFPLPFFAGSLQDRHQITLQQVQTAIVTWTEGVGRGEGEGGMKEEEEGGMRDEGGGRDREGKGE